uniref:Uncharacterized protein n=1 Tax=Anguilla anguilla TaxID=7936 RepID=A0A0E9R4D6_ANGAN
MTPEYTTPHISQPKI